MKFNNLIAITAIISLAGQASAQDGTLRRVVAQNDTIESAIIVNTNSSANTAVVPVQTQSQQPATVVEARPVIESKAESLRKARIGAEVSTEQKIVEKLEESRLKEEQDRADRLFGSKLDPAQAKALEEAAAAPAQKIAPQSALVVIPEQQAPAQITIQRIEIMQPAPQIESVREVAPVVAPAPAVSSVKAEVVEPHFEEPKGNKFYVNGSLGSVSYDASNVRGNFGGGFAVGILANERTAVEASFLYSNHYIDTFWNPGIYRELDQYDIGVNAKYYILDTRIKPYLGAGLAYITRGYSQRIVTSNGIQTQTVAGPSEDSTTAVNLGLMAGADFKVNEIFMIGGGVGYSTNLTNTNSFDFANYGILPENTKALEEIDFWTLNVVGTLTF